MTSLEKLEKAQAGHCGTSPREAGAPAQHLAFRSEGVVLRARRVAAGGSEAFLVGDLGGRHLAQSPRQVPKPRQCFQAAQSGARAERAPDRPPHPHVVAERSPPVSWPAPQAQWVCEVSKP